MTRYVATYLIVLGALAPLAARADTLYWLGAKLPNGATYADGGGDPMKYWVDETQTAPGGLPVANVEQEIRDAYQRWQDVDCAYIGFQFQGAITDPSQLGTHADTKNVMGSFVDSNTDPRYADDLGNGVAVGVALTYKNNGVIQGCDTEFNHHDWQYSDDNPATQMDFPSLANHENGHCLGLDHDPNDFNSVMYPTVNAGEMRRSLDAHDIDNACQLYPATGALGSPCSGSSCGSGLTCIQNPTAGGNFCSEGCDPTNASSCGAGFGCKSSTAISGSPGACFPGDGDFSPNVGAPCTANGGECHGSNSICITNFTGGYCSQYCDSLQCPTGDVCAQLDAQHFYCTAPCTTYAGGCRDGYTCYPSDGSGNGFCFPACPSNWSCGSNVCLADGVCYSPGNGASSVGHACLSVADCPTGGYCINGWPGGYCTAPCGSGQNANRPCDPGAACVLAGAEGQTYCLESCDSAHPCRGGYSCVVKTGADHTTQQVCAPGCQTDTDCAVGLSCRSGACVNPYATDAGPSCQLCGSDGGTIVYPDGGSGPADPAAAPSGCGCGASGSIDLFAALAVALAALAKGRRHAW